MPAMRDLPNRGRLTGIDGNVRFEKIISDFFYLPAQARAEYLARSPPLDSCFFEMAIPLLLRTTAVGEIQGFNSVRVTSCAQRADQGSNGAGIHRHGPRSRTKFGRFGRMATKSTCSIPCAS